MSPSKAILMMIIGMAFFATTDALIKFNSAYMSLPSILLVISLGGMSFTSFLLMRKGISIWSKAFFNPAVMTRNLCEAFGTFGITLALTLGDLTLVSAILQANPLLVTLGAALFLRETVGWRRWMAVILGLVGVLIIIRPSSEGISQTELLAVLGVIGMSGRDLATRRVPDHISTEAITFYGFGYVLPVALLMNWVLGTEITFPSAQIVPLLASVITVMIAYMAVTVSIRAGDISAVVPFRYTRIFFALCIGIFFFGERPDLMTYLGLAIIIGAGLYTFARENRVRAALS